MNIVSWLTQPPAKFVPLWLAATLFLVLGGCSREDIKTYQVPKEKVAQTPANPHGSMPPGHGDMAAVAKIEYQAPKGWEEGQLGPMRAAHFIAAGKNGQNADISVIPLPGATAPVRDIINMWREQVKLKLLSEADFSGTGEKVEIGAEQGQLYDMTGEEPVIDNKFKARTIAAILQHGDTLWIFKMIGESEAVGEQKPAFLAFLKTVRFKESSGTSAQMTAAAPNNPVLPPSATAPQKPAWDLPPNWKEQPPSQMLLAKFVVTGEQNAQAEITVSAFPGDVGGLLANVNRWRGQLGLAPIEEGELSKQISSFDVMGGKAILVDLTGTNPRTSQKVRLLSAIVQRGNQTWFYKMLGDEQVANSQKEAFIKFVQSVRYS